MPPTRYSDVLGQNAAVEAASDLIELPLKHADLFLRIGAKPTGHGIILAGPPGTGKALLARAQTRPPSTGCSARSPRARSSLPV